MNGPEILAQFRVSEDGFTELVRRYTNLVYSVAKRRVGNSTLALEVTQLVFIRLAKAAPNFQREAELGAWLHRTAVHVSIDLWRSEVRRRAREEQAALMQTNLGDEQLWEKLAPDLDEALNQLSDDERQTIVLRFFQQQTMRELGLSLGITEDAAKMRVSRALEKLRGQMGGRAAACTAGALAVLLVERGTEAAPAELLKTLSALRFSAATGAAVGGASAVLVKGGLFKPAAVTVGLAVIGVGAFLLLRNPVEPQRQQQTEIASADGNAEQGAAPATKVTGSMSGNKDNVSPSASNPVRILQAISHAREQITSGEVGFEVARYDFSRPHDGTNFVRLKIRFSGDRYRAETFGREYRFLALPDEGGTAAEKRIEDEQLSPEAAVKMGLLGAFESHHVAAFDGATFLDYWETDRKPFQVRVDEPAKGSGSYCFDPRCLGLTISPGISEPLNACLRYASSKAVQFVGPEAIDGVAALHLRVQLNQMARDFWVDAAKPQRVLKFAYNGSEVVSIYDDAHSDDALPIEVRVMFLHGTTGRNTAFAYSRFRRTSAKYNLPIPASSWTLAGLGIQPGTEVVDYRISRRIGYWTGTGLSQDLPRESKRTNSTADLVGFMDVLQNEPASPAALDAAKWVIFNTPSGPDVDLTSEIIIREHITSTNLLDVCLELERLRPACSSNLLTAMLQQNPNNEIRGNACFSLAMLAKAQWGYGTNKQATARAKGLLSRVIKDFGKVQREGARLEQRAKPELMELERLSIGEVAPEITGETLDGQPLALSSYRGKVVVLRFWSGDCLEGKEMRRLSDRVTGKPVQLLGVNCDVEVGPAKAEIEKYAVEWPSFNDGRSGPISTTWYVNSWPTTFVLDRRGVIRFRNLRDTQLIKAVEQLAAE